MKTLLVLRHAKAEQPESGQLDFDRDLTKRGKLDAEKVGQHLAELKLLPQAIVASAAKRTRKTAQRVAESLGFSGEVVTTRELYDACLGDIISVVRQLALDADVALIVGHNPGMAELVSALGEPTPSYPTASLACLRLPIDDWQQASHSRRGELVWIWRPQTEDSGE